MKTIYIIRSLFLAIGILIAFNEMSENAYAQESPDVGSVEKKDDAAHPALRGFAELGMGALFGTISGGTALITSLVLKPTDIRPALISSAILYPIGIGCGAILGGYLTDTKSGYWEPFVGAFTGALVADVTAYFLSEDYPIFSGILVIVLPLVTTLIAMETSHAWHDREDSHKRESLDKAVMPLSFGFAF